MNSAIISTFELEKFAVDLLVATSSSRDDAEVVARTMVWADLRGRFQQGVFRIPVLANMLKHRLVTSPTAMDWTELSPTMFLLDARNGFGQVAGERAMQKAINVAKTMGMGMVTVRGSNHYGAAAYYCALAADEHCLGLTMTNASPKVAPHGGTKAILGTNPIAFGAPTRSGVPLLVDFSTASIAGSTIRTLNEAGGKLPEGVALDANGRPTTDPAALATGSLLPAAGPKGFGLGLMVEILCGILSGAGMSYEVGPFYSTWKRSVNPGHVFIAIDIERCLPLDSFLDRMDELIVEIKSSPKQDEAAEILLPGEIRGRYARQYSHEGIPLNQETMHTLEVLATTVGIDVPWKQQASVL